MTLDAVSFEIIRSFGEQQMLLGLAARAAAERIAEMLGEQPGGTVGYATRMDSKSSARTRLLVLTEGIFVRRIQDDP